jgi:hypothetical protein
MEVDIDVFFSEDVDFIFSYFLDNKVNSLYAFSVIINNLFVKNAVQIIAEGIRINYFIIDELLDNFLELFITKDLFFLIQNKTEYYHKMYNNSTLFLCSINSLKIFDHIYKNSDLTMLDFYKDNEDLILCLDYEIANKYHNNVIWKKYCLETFDEPYINRLKKLYLLPSYIFQDKLYKVNYMLDIIDINQRTISNIPIVHFCNSVEMLNLFVSRGVNIYKKYLIYLNDHIFKADVCFSMAYVSHMYYHLQDLGYHFDDSKLLLLKVIENTNNSDLNYYNNAVEIIDRIIKSQREKLRRELPDYLYYKIEEFIFLK